MPRVSDRGQDVTGLVRESDLQAAPPGSRDRRFVGRTEEHVVTLTFDLPLDQLPGDPVLVMNGWIEYPYSQTMFAAWQARASYEPATIEARGADGRWLLLLDRFGYIAGMPGEASVPLPRDRLPAGATELRIRTNMEIYWDRLAVVCAEPCAGVRQPRATVTGGPGARGGICRTLHAVPGRPHYDYDRLLPLWDTQHQAGSYTSFGPILPLVAETDDAVAIIGPGEEVHLEFQAAGGDPAAGWTRRFMLQAHGWCKDRDLYTKDGDTVEPLPRRGGAADGTAQRRQQLHDAYNSRYRWGG